MGTTLLFFPNYPFTIDFRIFPFLRSSFKFPATGSKLLKDYVRDRLYRHGFLPSDEAWFREENNNVVNISVAEIHATDNDDVEDQRRLSVGRSLSRSSSFNSGSRSPSAGRNSFSIDGRLPDSDRAKI